MRSWPYPEGARERILEERYRPKPRRNEVDRRIAVFMDGRLLTGVDTKHRLPSARLFRLRLRLRAKFTTHGKRLTRCLTS